MVAVLLSFSLCPLIAAAQETNNAKQQDAKAQAADLFASGKYELALAAYQNRLKTESENQTVLSNAGQSAFMIGKYEIALEMWLKLEELAGADDLGTKEKLIQAYSRLNRDDDVTKRVAELTKLRKETSDEKYKNKRSFCRDQFAVDGQRIIIHQHFDYPDDEIQYSAYLINDSTGKPDVTFRLWSSKTTNAIAREHGELKDNERFVHIDEYQPDGSKTNHLHSKSGVSFADFKKRISEVVEKR